MKTVSWACRTRPTLGVGGVGQGQPAGPERARRERRSGAFAGLEQSPMLEDRVAIGHPGDVISDCASSAGGSVRGFRLQRRVAVLRRHETHVLEKCLEKLLHHPPRLRGHAQHLVVAVDVLAQERLELQVLLAAGVAQHRQRQRLRAHFIDRARLRPRELGLRGADEVDHDVVDHAPDGLVHQAALAKIRIERHDGVVLPPEHAHLAQRGQVQQLRADAIIHVVIVVGDFVGEIGDLRFEPRLAALDEALIANLADEIAYNNHDVDDGIRAQLLDLSALREVRMFRRQYDAVVALYPDLGERRLVHETIRRMINYIVVDFIRTTQTQLTRAQPRSIDEVRAQPLPLAMLSDSCREEHLELKAFLREHVYRHYKVLRMTSKARRVVQQLFEALFKDVSLMPPEYRDTALQAETAHGAAGRARAVADYIAGMTDRYAILEHRRLFEPGERT